MKTVKFLIALLCITSFLGCDDKDSETIVFGGAITIEFNHYWDGEKITSTDFNVETYTNANNDILTISKLRYLVSNIILHKPDGSSTKLVDYYLVDLTNDNTSFSISDIIDTDSFSSISFTFGFNETDNIDGNYIDLNSASWNWPTMLGGGYHFMQFEGKYGATGTENPFAYHMGTARVSPGVFEQNFFDVSLGGFTSSESETIIEIKMNLDQWFENPYTWDLDTYNTTLMPNYDAQKLMQQNGASVFSLGTIN